MVLASKRISDRIIIIPSLVETIAMFEVAKHPNSYASYTTGVSIITLINNTPSHPPVKFFAYSLP